MCRYLPDPVGLVNIVLGVYKGITERVADGEEHKTN